jgi:L-threonylcarbamoyladenylate synthase
MSALQNRPLGTYTPENSPYQGRPQELDTAVLVLREGGVVAFPTDTLYGLGADVFNASALQRVFDIKGRPAELALPVLVADWPQVEVVAVGLTEAARRLAAAFWPGSLTLVLPKSPSLSLLVTGGRDTVAVRMPDHPAPLTLAAQLGRPITGTSANRSGEADLKTLAAVQATLGGSVDCIVDFGPPPQGTPSTVVDLTGDVPALIREGAIPFAEVLRVWNE